MIWKQKQSSQLHIQFDTVPAVLRVVQKRYIYSMATATFSRAKKVEAYDEFAAPLSTLNPLIHYTRNASVGFSPHGSQSHNTHRVVSTSHLPQYCI